MLSQLCPCNIFLYVLVFFSCLPLLAVDTTYSFKICLQSLDLY